MVFQTKRKSRGKALRCTISSMFHEQEARIRKSMGLEQRKGGVNREKKNRKLLK